MNVESGISSGDDNFNRAPAERKRDRSGELDANLPLAKRVPTEVKIVLQSNLKTMLSHTGSVLSNAPVTGLPHDTSDNSLPILVNTSSGKSLLNLHS
jgi:hypothetical protein